MLCAEVSIYPQNTANSDQIVNSSIHVLDNQGVNYKVGSLSTHIDGNEQEVWSGIKSLFDQAQSSGEVTMVVTLSNTGH